MTDLRGRGASALAGNTRWRIVMLSLLALAMSTPADAQSTYGHLRIVVPSAPGGGFDLTARAMQPVLRAAGLVRTSSVENVAGGGGTIGLARFVTAEEGKSDVVLLSGLATLGAMVSYRSVLTFADVTPIARLMGEYEVIVVPVASPFRSLSDLIGAFRRRPASISWAGGGPGGSEHLLALLIADALGVDPNRVNYIAFAGAGESNPAVLGGQVSVGLNPLSTVVPYIDAGTLRVLGVSSAERLPSLDAPTLREQGVNVEFEAWRALFAPPGVSTGDRRRLEEAVEAMVQSPAWRDTLVRYGWNDRFLSGPAFARFLQTDEARVRELVLKRERGVGEASGVPGPYATVVVVGLLSMALAFAIRARRSRRLIEPPGAGWRAVVLVAAGIVVDLAAIEYLGFILASIGLFWLTARAFDARHPVRDGAFAVVLSFAAYVLFVQILDLSLPPGLLAGLL